MNISKILAGIEAAERMERKIEALAKPFMCQLAAYETAAEKCARQFAPYQAAADRIVDQLAPCQAAAERIARQFAAYETAAEPFVRQHAAIEAMISSNRTWNERNPEPDFARIMPRAMPMPVTRVGGPEIHPGGRSGVRPEVKRRVGYHWE